MGLIALGRLDKGVLEQGFLNLAPIDLVDEVAQRIDFGPYQLVFHILGIEEAAHATLLDVDLHFGAYVINLVRAVEYRDGQYEIDGNDDVYQYKQRFLPVDAHDFVIYYLLFSILDWRMVVIWGTILSRSPAPKMMSTSKERFLMRSRTWSLRTSCFWMPGRRRS